MQPVIRHSFVSFPRNAKPKVSVSFHECGELRTWTICIYLGENNYIVFLSRLNICLNLYHTFLDNVEHYHNQKQHNDRQVPSQTEITKPRSNICVSLRWLFTLTSVVSAVLRYKISAVARALTRTNDPQASHDSLRSVFAINLIARCQSIGNWLSWEKLTIVSQVH